MDYREIVAVTGIGGLFQMITTKSDGAIVRNLADNTTKFISARLHNITPLESIEIYTTGANVRLHEVLEKIKAHEENEPIIDYKKADNKEIKSYLKTIFPDIDEERVYVSDMKKMLRWYEILKSNDLLNFDFYKAEEKATEESETDAPTEKAIKKENSQKAEADEKAENLEEAVAPDKTVAKKTATKKKVAKKDASPNNEETAKKAAPKKAAKKKPTE